MKKNSVSVFLLSVCIIFLFYSCGEKKQAVTEGKISFFTGEVAVNEKTAGIDTPVTAGSRVTTGKDSECEVIFNEKNILHFLPESDIIVDLASLHKKIHVNTGGVAGVLKNLNINKKEKGDFTVETAIAAASVRGTVLFLKAEDPSNTYICDCYGTVVMNDTTVSNNFDVESKHHKAFRFTKIESGVSSTNAGLLYHDDQSMQKIADKIGETIDWDTNSGYEY